MLHLENEFLSVSISEQGAELNSVLYKPNHSEQIWCADPAFWGRHAPLLFPVIGRLRNQQYTLNDKLYSISRHGFARDKQFIVQNVSSDTVELVLQSDTETRKSYPWDFTLTVRYVLKGHTLKREFIISNHSDTPMYYELGGHDAYQLDLSSAALTDYYVEFEGISDEIQTIGMDADGLLTREHHPITLDHGRWYLGPNAFPQDTLIFDQLPVRRCTLGCTKHPNKITVDFEDFEFFALWSQYKLGKDTPFLCLEPWSALPECNYLGQALEEKIGIRKIAPNQSEVLNLTLVIE